MNENHGTIAATNIAELASNVLSIHNALCSGAMQPKEALEIHNGVGKISSLLKLQLEYHKMRGERPDIEFLNAPPTTKTIEHGRQKALTA